MSTSDYYVGLFFFAATYGAVLLAAEIAVRRRLPQLRGAIRLLAWAVLATLGVIAVHLVPAALTVLSRETALLAAAILLGGTWLLPATPRTPEVGFPEPASDSGDLDKILAAIGVVAFIVWVGLAARKYLYSATESYDTVSAYLPTAARWLQEGSIWDIADWVPNAFYGSSPGNGSLVVLSTMLPWDNDFLAHLAIYPYVILTAVALYALARELGAPPPAAALAGVMLSSVPVVVVPGLLDALLDPVMYATFATGLLFLVRHHRTGSNADLVLAGLALGIAFGTKFYSYTAVTAVLVVWGAARLLARIPVKTVLRQGVAIGALVLLAGGVWMVRNLVETGNPLLPLKIELFGTTVFDAPPDPMRPLIGQTIADYLDQPDAWGELVHQFRIAVGIPLIVLGLAALTSVVLMWRRWRSETNDSTDGVALALLAAAALLTVTYAVTPYSAPGADGQPVAAAINVRYGIPAAIAALGLAGWVSGRIGRRGLLAFELACLVGTLDALRVGTVTPRGTVYAAFAVGVLAAAAIWGLRRAEWRPSMPSRPAIAAAGLVAIVLIALGGQRLEERFNDSRYVGADPALDWVIASSGDGETVGITGAWTLSGVAPIYPSFGPRLQNSVEYVGSVDDGLLTVFDDRAPFADAISRMGIEVLVIGRAPPTVLDPARAAVAQPTPLGSGRPREQGWARMEGFNEVASSDRFVVMSRQ